MLAFSVVFKIMAQSKLTKNLKTPRSKEEFTRDKEWARRIIVEYMKKTDPEWLLASCLKVMDVIAKENPAPGKIQKVTKCIHSFIHVSLQ